MVVVAAVPINLAPSSSLTGCAGWADSLSYSLRAQGTGTFKPGGETGTVPHDPGLCALAAVTEGNLVALSLGKKLNEACVGNRRT